MIFLPVELLHHIANELRLLHPYSMGPLASTNRLMRDVAAPHARTYIAVKGARPASRFIQRAVEMREWARNIRGIAIVCLSPHHLDTYFSFLDRGSSLFPRCAEVVLEGDWWIRRDMPASQSQWTSVRTLAFGTTTGDQPRSVRFLTLVWLGRLFPCLEVLDLSAVSMILDWPANVRRALSGPPRFRHVRTFILRGDVGEHVTWHHPYAMTAVQWLGNQFPTVQSVTLSASPALSRCSPMATTLARLLQALLSTAHELDVGASQGCAVWDELGRMSQAMPTHSRQLRALKVVVGPGPELSAVLGFVAQVNMEMEVQIRCLTNMEIDSQWLADQQHKHAVVDLFPGVRLQQPGLGEWHTLHAITRG